MIDLTPLDVRKKRGDFRKQLRGYDPEEVDGFLDLVAERLEELVKENLTLRERSDRLHDQVSSQQGREKAVQDALVTAQQLRDDIRDQAQREADDVRGRAERESEELRTRTEQECRLARREAAAEARGILEDAERRAEGLQRQMEDLERKRLRFLKGFRQLLQREMEMVEVEEGRTPLEDVTVDLDLGGGRPGRGSPVRGGLWEEEEDVEPADAPDTAEAVFPNPSGDLAPVDPDAPVHELAGAVAEELDALPEADGGRSDPEAAERSSSAEGASAEGDRRERRPAAKEPRDVEEPELWLSSVLDDDAETDEEPREG